MTVPDHLSASASAMTSPMVRTEQDKITVNVPSKGNKQCQDHASIPCNLSFLPTSLSTAPSPNILKLPRIQINTASIISSKPNVTVAKATFVQNGELCPQRCTTESFYGYIEGIEDAALVIEACRQGRLPRVKKRLSERERSQIRSGSIFVFLERESGIRRWTDGNIWSPSRICGDFLMYRELCQRPSTKKHGSNVHDDMIGGPVENDLSDCNSDTSTRIHSISTLKLADKIDSEDNQQVTISGATTTTRELSGVDTNVKAAQPLQAHSLPLLSPSPILRRSSVPAILPMESAKSQLLSTQMEARPQSLFKRNGLIKKTVSMMVAGEVFHLVAYFADPREQPSLLAMRPSKLGYFHAMYLQPEFLSALKDHVAIRESRKFNDYLKSNNISIVAMPPSWSRIEPTSTLAVGNNSREKTKIRIAPKLKRSFTETTHFPERIDGLSNSASSSTKSASHSADILQDEAAEMISTLSSIIAFSEEHSLFSHFLTAVRDNDSSRNGSSSTKASFDVAADSHHPHV